MMTASQLFKINGSLSNLATAVDYEQTSAIALYAVNLWNQCTELNPTLSLHGTLPCQEVFIEPVKVHALVRLQSAVASYTNAVFLDQAQPRQLKLIKYCLEIICDLFKINHEPLLK